MTRTDNYNYSFAPERKAATSKVFDVADYGANPVGSPEEVSSSKDNTGAIQAALNAAKNAGGGVVYMKGGYYKVSGSLTIPTGVELRGTFEGPHYGNGTAERITPTVRLSLPCKRIQGLTASRCIIRNRASATKQN